MDKKITIEQFKDKFIELLQVLKDKTNNFPLKNELDYYIKAIPYKAPEQIASVYLLFLNNVVDIYITQEIDNEKWFREKCNELVTNTVWN